MSRERNTSGHSGAPGHVRDDRLLLERLQAFGLIESNGKGGWRLTEHCKAGLARLQTETDASVHTVPVKMRPWTPRKVSV